jgi:transcriptional regulator with XRE-family HTH domain
MITEIGKFLRKERIDRSLLLKDMAEGIGVSAAYLSTIETGKRQVTRDLVMKLAEFLGYGAGTEQFAALEQAALMSKDQIEIETRGMSIRHREAALAFSRQFSEIGEGDLERILKVLNSAQRKG